MPRSMRGVARMIGIAVACCVAGCSSAWKPAGGPYGDAGLALAVDVPEGWYRVAGAPRSSIILTKDGISLQTITVGRFDLDRKLPNSSQRFLSGMTPEEAADVDISNHQFAPGIDGFKLLERGSVVVDGNECYQYLYLYLETSGRPRKVKDVGCIIAPHIYRFHFTAPAEKWFGESLAAFDRFVASARFVSS